MLHPGTVLQNRYSIVRLLNIGGTAIVYEATDRRLNISVALKELEPVNRHLQQMMAREALILARLRHPALPIVFDSFTERKHLYLVMQLVAGPDLGLLLAQRCSPFPLAQVVRWADRLLDALVYLHRQRPAIIHRDIKPHNLKLNDEGEIMLLDFGLAKVASAINGNGVAGTPSIVGYTLDYAPLEQIRGEGTDERSDLFALAATLYEFVTGIRPPDALERATAVLSGIADPLVFAQAPQLTPALANLLRTALALTPHARPSSAALFRKVFSEVVGQLPAVQPTRLEQRYEDTFANLVLEIPVTTLPAPRSLPTGTISLLCMRVMLYKQMNIDDVVQACIASLTELSGVVFKITGSIVCAAFADATDALAAALRVQQTLQEYDATAAQALHSGVAEERDGGYFGAVVDRSERLLAACHAGQIVLSRAVEELVYDRLPPKVTLRDLGTHRSKEQFRPEHIFQVVFPQLPSDFPPLAILDQRIGNLPPPPDALIGREQEVTAVCKLFRQSNVRLLTLIGPGGTGKTRLSLEATAALAEDFADGVCFVPLASIHAPALVVSAIAQALGVQETGNQPLDASLKTYLQPKCMLLLLDNFEQIIAAAPIVDELLMAAPDVCMLVTSREPLHLAVERTFLVPPLAVPNLDHGSNQQARNQPASLAQYGAVTLFVERARVAQPSFVLTASNAEIVSAICRRLDGLPLAIELAAARLRLFQPAALLARLNGAYRDTPLRLLTGGDEKRPARQQTLRQAIAWSYDLLNNDEQMLFRQLAAFVGGCTLEAIESVCRVNSQETGGRNVEQLALQPSVLDILVSLLDKSLLQREQQPDGEPRFVLLETLREFGLEQVIVHDEIEMLRRRHAGYCFQWAECAEPELRGADQLQWLDRMDREHDNMRAALDWASVHDGHLGLQLASALGVFWVTRGYLSEGHQRLSTVLALTHEPTVTRAKAFYRAGNLCFHQSDFPRASDYYQASLQLYQELDDPIGSAWVLYGLGRMQRTYETAHSYLSQSLSIFRKLGDQAGKASALNEMGNVERWHGSYATAQSCHEESVELYRALVDQVGLTDALNGLSQVLMQQGEFTRAQACVTESVSLCRKTGSRLHLAWGLQALGCVTCAQGDLPAAHAAFEESLALFTTLNDRAGMGWSLYDRGRVMLRQGDYPTARSLLEESLALFRTMSDIWGVSWALTMLGVTVLREGDRIRARACFTESLPLFHQSGNKQGVIYTLEGWANLVIEENAEQAIRLYATAMQARETHHMPLTPVDRLTHARDVARARAQLTDTAFEAAWSAGSAMTLDQASTFILKESK